MKKPRPLLLVLMMLRGMQLFSQSNDQDNSIAPELVGKWCFINLAAGTTDALTNSCITLNADGTFEAVLDRAMLPNVNAFSGMQDSDSGTWYAKGNRIFYSSPTNGQGSFNFQKTNHPRLNIPMIVVNGISFATASSHDPW